MISQTSTNNNGVVVAYFSNGVDAQRAIDDFACGKI